MSWAKHSLDTKAQIQSWNEQEMGWIHWVKEEMVWFCCTKRVWFCVMQSAMQCIYCCKSGNSSRLLHKQTRVKYLLSIFFNLYLKICKTIWQTDTINLLKCTIFMFFCFLCIGMILAKMCWKNISIAKLMACFNNLARASN